MASNLFQIINKILKAINESVEIKFLEIIFQNLNNNLVNIDLEKYVNS